MENIRQKICDYDEEILLLPEQYDDCIVGLVSRCGMEVVALYDSGKLAACYMSEGMEEDEAWEHFEFNVAGAYVGPKTPMFTVELPNF